MNFINCTLPIIPNLVCLAGLDRTDNQIYIEHPTNVNVSMSNLILCQLRFFFVNFANYVFILCDVYSAVWSRYRSVTVHLMSYSGLPNKTYH